jgi:hypothetical protein
MIHGTVTLLQFDNKLLHNSPDLDLVYVGLHWGLGLGLELSVEHLRPNVERLSGLLSTKSEIIYYRFTSTQDKTQDNEHAREQDKTKQKIR